MERFTYVILHATKMLEPISANESEISYQIRLSQNLQKYNFPIMLNYFM